MKKRLPVLQTAQEPAEPERPPHHWIGFGTVAIFAAWLPLAALVQLWVSRALSARLGTTNPGDVATRFAALSAGEKTKLALMIALPHTLALFLAAFAGGFLVTRFGGKTTVREAWLAGFSAGTIACVLSFVSSGISWPPLVALALCVLAAWLGGRRGQRKPTIP